MEEQLNRWASQSMALRRGYFVQFLLFAFSQQTKKKKTAGGIKSSHNVAPYKEGHFIR